MLLHDISVHIFMPAGIASPGFIEEEKEKPKVTKKIEESDTQISPEECAKHLIAGALHPSLRGVGGCPADGDVGIEKGYYQFSSHLIGDLIRVVSKGSAPFNNPFIDGLLYIIATVSPLSFVRVL